jgi:acyl-homoserine lactone acylase PvdQ
MARVNLGFNWFYADSRDMGFLQSGWFPHRGRGTDPSLPAWGTGRWDWRRFNPRTFTESHIGPRGLPKDSDPRRGYLINWNNDAARGWSAADDEWSYGPIYRSQLFERQIAPRRKLSLTELVQIMESAVTTDLRGRLIYPLLRRVIGRHPPRSVRPALAALGRWVADGAYRRDLDRDNVYENSAGIALMDAWWPLLMRAEFQPVLGPRLLDAIQAMVPFDRSPSSDYTSYGVGWYGYVDKDLRMVLGQRVRGRFSRRYCGRGSLRRCRAAIVGSLSQALAQVSSQQGPDLAAWKVYATCQVHTPQSCDQLQFETGGAVDTPPIPWQNRPTFQQAVEVTGRR